MQRYDFDPDTGRAWSLLRRRRQRTRRRWALTGAVAAGAITLVAYPPARAFAHRCAEACMIAVSPAGKAGFEAEDQWGRGFRLAELRGRVVVLNFWATWCSPCVEELPWLDQMARELGPRGVSVVGASLDEAGWAAVKPFLARHPVSYPVILGNDAVLSQYGEISALPATVILSREGEVRAVHRGRIDPAALRAQVEKALE